MVHAIYNFRPSARRRGVAAVLAMLYLVLFSVLALGFYAATTTAVQVSGNEKRSNAAFFAAESGMNFMRYQLAQITLPHSTPPSGYWNLVSAYMLAHLSGTVNVGAAGVDAGAALISIPAGGGYIELNDGTSRFRATLQKVNDYGVLRLKVIGRYKDTDVVRALQVDYVPVENASKIFDYGIASKGRIYTKGAARIRGATDPTKGSILSTITTDPVPVQISGKEVSGDISISSTTGQVLFDPSASIGGTNNSTLIEQDHIHKGVTAPEFPQVDPSGFAAYATNTFAGGTDARNLTNTRIPANTGTPAHPLKFTGTTAVTGVLYVEAPNVVEFGGNTSIQGTVVVQNGVPTNLTNNVLSFTGSVSATGVETLPASYGDLRKLTGSFILAPGFLVNFTGNFGTVNGSIVSSQLTMSGNAGGTVKGTVINVDPSTLTLDGSSEIVIASTGTSNYPAGLFFDSHFGPAADTYLEVQP